MRSPSHRPWIVEVTPHAHARYVERIGRAKPHRIGNMVSAAMWDTGGVVRHGVLIVPLRHPVIAVLDYQRGPHLRCMTIISSPRQWYRAYHQIRPPDHRPP